MHLLWAMMQQQSEENEVQEADDFEGEEEHFEVVDHQEKESKTYLTSWLATYCNSSKDIQ